MARFQIPQEAVRLTTPNPSLLLQNLGLANLRANILPKFERGNQGDFQGEFGYASSFLESRIEKKPFGADDKSEKLIQSSRTSYFGTPIIDFIRFDYKDLEPVYLDCVLYDISEPKNIVKTPIQGKKKTVKEYISDGDVGINIKGVICSKDGRTYPYEEVQRLREFLAIPDAINVYSNLLSNVFNIFSIVVEDRTFPRTAGFFGMQSFEIMCVSDEPIEVKITNDKK